MTTINFDHPLFKNVFEKRVANFQYPKVATFFEFSTSASQILSYSDQTPFLIDIHNDFASLYVFSSAINKENSNFQNAPLIVPVFYNMVLNNQNTAVNAINIGSNNPILIETILEKDDILRVQNET